MLTEENFHIPQRVWKKNTKNYWNKLFPGKEKETAGSSIKSGKRNFFNGKRRGGSVGPNRTL